MDAVDANVDKVLLVVEIPPVVVSIAFRLLED